MTDGREEPAAHRALVPRMIAASGKRSGSAPVDSPEALASTSGRRVFLIGGSLITVSAVGDLFGDVSTVAMLGSLAASGDPSGRAGAALFVDILVALLFAAALVLFAVGMRGEGSVVARRPIGTVALIVTALAWVAQRIPLPESLQWLSVWHWIVIVAGAVAAVEIIRIRAVRGGARFLPLVLVLALLAIQLAVVAILTLPLGEWSRLGWGAMLVLFGLPVVSLVSLAIGVCALVGGARARPSARVTP